MVKHKKILIAILMVLLILILFWDNISSEYGSNELEKTAIIFVEAMLDGDADKCTDLMCDELIESSGYESEKLFTRALQQTLDSIIDDYKNEFGNRWKYTVTVIDVLEYSSLYDGEEMKKVILQIDHKSRSIFNKKEATEDFVLIMTNIDGKWLVYDFPLN